MNRHVGGPSVLHLTTTIDRGGAENYLVDLIRGQLAAGYSAVTCAYLKGAPYWRETLEGMGVTVLDLGSRFYGDPAAVLRLRGELRRRRPDVLHVHGAPVELYAVAALPFRNRPALILTRHEPRRRLFEHIAYRLFDRIISKAADRIIAVSGSVMAEDVARRPELASKSSVVHHGIRADFASMQNYDRGGMRRELGIGDDDVLIGTVARHTSEKSIDTLLRAFALCRSRTAGRAHPRLLLIGRGPLTDQLKALADELGIAEQLAWLPFRDDMAAVMRAFDIFALPSREEGFGIVLLEAMACELPVVACCIDAIPEIIADGETGLLVPARDSDRMAEALERLVTDPAARARLGGSGRNRVESSFTIEAMQKKTLAIYAELEVAPR